MQHQDDLNTFLNRLHGKFPLNRIVWAIGNDLSLDVFVTLTMAETSNPDLHVFAQQAVNDTLEELFPGVYIPVSAPSQEIAAPPSMGLDVAMVVWRFIIYRKGMAFH